MKRKGGADHVRTVEKEDKESDSGSGIHDRFRAFGRDKTWFDVIKIALETSGAVITEADAGNFAVHPDCPLRQPADEEYRRGSHHIDWGEPFSL